MNHSSRLLLAAAVCGLAATAVQAEPVTYQIDPTHTFVTFEARHFNTSTIRGRFDKKEGTVQFDRAGKSGKVELTMDTASVSTGVAPLDKHLQSDDFLAAAKFPQARFVADKFSFDGDKVSEVSGQLTLRDKTAPVTLKAIHFNCYQSPMLKREVCGGDFETTLNKAQFNALGFVDSIRLLVQVEAVRQ